MIFTMKNILKWFRLNSVKANPEKFQCMILGDKTCYKHILTINLTSVQSSDDITLLGVMIDKNLTFKIHNDNLVRKAQYKPHALRCIRKFLTFLLYGRIFLRMLNPTIQFSNLKPKLKIWEILIVDV